MSLTKYQPECADPYISLFRQKHEFVATIHNYDSRNHDMVIDEVYRVDDISKPISLEGHLHLCNFTDEAFTRERVTLLPIGAHIRFRGYFERYISGGYEKQGIRIDPSTIKVYTESGWVSLPDLLVTKMNPDYKIL